MFTEMIDLALSVLPTDVGPAHVKLVLEWSEPEKYFCDMTDAFVEHESVSQFKVCDVIVVPIGDEWPLYICFLIV